MSLDFLVCTAKNDRKGSISITPNFRVAASKDLMIRGGTFYAVWDSENHIWSREEFRLVELIDREVAEKAGEVRETFDGDVKPNFIINFQSKKWTEFKNYAKSLPDMFHELDQTVTFSDSDPTRDDYVSRKLPYSLSPGPCPNYDELMSTLYDDANRAKLEWAIGAIFMGDSLKLQKFIVIYGSGGTGKSTFLNVLEQLFEGYTGTIDAKAMGEKSNPFALVSLAKNPLVGIQHDGDLSRIEDNTRLNSVVAHERIDVNEKYKAPYPIVPRSFLFMGTNRPVRITDAKSGIIRRLVDVQPTGKTLPADRYFKLINAIPFELGQIASHCIEVYKSMGKHYYDSYKPSLMIGESNDFYNFVEEMYPRYSRENTTTLNESWLSYKEYCDESNVKYPFSKRVFKNELKNYFEEFEDRGSVNGKQVWNIYRIFKRDLFDYDAGYWNPPSVASLELNSTESLFDELYSGQPAQKATKDGKPKRKWANVTTVLGDIDTHELHYVKVPENHIVIDFDLQDGDGNKLLEENLKAAALWPATYAELSKSGAGVHLHYIYDGDPSRLSRVYDDNVEVKVYSGNSSLRRKLTLCNDIPVAHISSGLPLKGGDEKVIQFEGLKNEKALRTLIKRNMNKEVHPGTKPSVDFIKHILDRAYEDGMHYDVTDMRPAVMAFAANSTHHSSYCLELVNKMPFKSEEPSEAAQENGDETVIFFDVEVFPNLFVLVWKAMDKNPVKLINPTSQDVEELMKFRLVGFNCRRYDNHILYGRMMGYDNEELYRLSKRIIEKSRNAFFSEAYNISYADVYEFSSKKQSLKKFEVELGIHHQELGFDWDQPVPEDKWQTVADYCVNDVVSTEAVFKARHEDFVARELLAELSGLRINDTARQHATRILFGNDRHPQSQFVYTDLSTIFPGYKFEAGHSSYHGEDPGEGGYVYAEPGMYTDVALLDISSMHPTSIIELNMFGKYTKNFKDIVDARLAVKHKDYEAASKMFDGRFARYLDTPENSDALAQALKMVINPIYGYTKATFDCEFRDPRNVDNIVAKRGALFMINLKEEVQKRGFTVAHIKTDSIKIPNATEEIISFVMDYGKEYGYTFEHEDTYSKMCLVNDAVYIAKSTMGKHAGKWTATGLQFQVPYVFKTLFSHEKIEFEDLCEMKSVGGNAALYLYFDGDEPNYRFVGKVGSFCPMKPDTGGGVLLRGDSGKYTAATGTKGYLWLESEVVRNLDKQEDIDRSYYTRLVDDAVETISKFCDFEEFVGD